MAPDSNLVNVGTIVYVVLTRGPILESIERDSVNQIPCTVCGYNIKKGLEAVGLSNCRANTNMIVKEKNGTTRTAWAVGL